MQWRPTDLFVNKSEKQNVCIKGHCDLDIWQNR